MPGVPRDDLLLLNSAPGATLYHKNIPSQSFSFFFLLFFLTPPGAGPRIKEATFEHAAAIGGHIGRHGSVAFSNPERRIVAEFAECFPALRHGTLESGGRRAPLASSGAGPVPAGPGIKEATFEHDAGIGGHICRYGSVAFGNLERRIVAEFADRLPTAHERCRGWLARLRGMTCFRHGVGSTPSGHRHNRSVTSCCSNNFNDAVGASPSGKCRGMPYRHDRSGTVGSEIQPGIGD